MKAKHKKVLLRILISAVLLVLLNLISLSGMLRILAFTVTYLIIGYDILLKALRGVINGRIFDENFLMTIATLGAFALAVCSGSGDFNEAVAVMLFYQTGELFQAIAVGKSRKNIADLLDIRPDYANLDFGDEMRRVSPDEVDVGSVIVVNPGEKIPIDGIVTEGSAFLDTSALTGESVPQKVAVGDEVISGCINTNSMLKIKTIKSFGASTASKILELVENASSKKSKHEKFISKFARVYTPVVCASALVLGVFVPVIINLFGTRVSFEEWIYRALTFLVISCPCALVISIPLTFFSGIGGAGRRGILIKGSNYIEVISKTDTVVFDKTGTLTKGDFEVVQIKSFGAGDEKILEYASHAECATSHPIGKSIERAYGKTIDRQRVSDICEHSGRGVTAIVDGCVVAAGNYELMEMNGVDAENVDSDKTIVHIAIDGVYSGYIVIADSVKATSQDAIRALRNIGVKNTVMLTGDSEPIAKFVAEELGIDKVYSKLLPSDKVVCMENIISTKNASGSVAYVGDGINDAPVLARADAGIAMGAMGSDSAIEAADVVLMQDDLMQLVTAIEISKKCMAIAKQNIVISLSVKFVCLAFVTFGMATMWAGIVADVGVMVVAVLNAIRTLSVK